MSKSKLIVVPNLVAEMKTSMYVGTSIEKLRWQISCTTREFHASKSLKYTFTRVSLWSHSTNLLGHWRVAHEVWTNMSGYLSVVHKRWTYLLSHLWVAHKCMILCTRKVCYSWGVYYVTCKIQALLFTITVQTSQGWWLHTGESQIKQLFT